MRPLQKPRPPIVVAASNDKMVQRVARLGDAWTIAGHATLATLERQVALYRAALEVEGRPFPPPLFRLGKELYIAPDMDTALRQALQYIAMKYEAYAQWGQDTVLPAGAGSMGHRTAGCACAATVCMSISWRQCCRSSSLQERGCYRS